MGCQFMPSTSALGMQVESLLPTQLQNYWTYFIRRKVHPKGMTRRHIAGKCNY